MRFYSEQNYVLTEPKGVALLGTKFKMRNWGVWLPGAVLVQMAWSGCNITVQDRGQGQTESSGSLGVSGFIGRPCPK